MIYEVVIGGVTIFIFVATMIAAGRNRKASEEALAEVRRAWGATEQSMRDYEESTKRLRGVVDDFLQKQPEKPDVFDARDATDRTPSAYQRRLRRFNAQLQNISKRGHLDEDRLIAAFHQALSEATREGGLPSEARDAFIVWEKRSAPMRDWYGGRVLASGSSLWSLRDAQAAGPYWNAFPELSAGGMASETEDVA